jgi:ABC-type Mn2+/Zn2+ transport system ATPase subunit
VHSYFDWALLLNRTIIAAGPVEKTVRAEYVCAAYGRNDVFVERAL